MIFPLRDTQPSHQIPWVCIALIVVNAVLFFYEVYLDPYSRNSLIAEWGVTPAHLVPWTLVTYMFLHGNWFHLIGNLWFLWIYGDNVEDILGRLWFPAFYLLCGVAAAGTQVLLASDSRLPTVGASGALAGVLGAYLVKFPHARILTLIFAIFIFTIEVPAALLLAVWFAVQLWAGVSSYGEANLGRDGVAWFAHIGGFVAGAALIHILPTRPRYSNRRDLHW